MLEQDKSGKRKYAFAWNLLGDVQLGRPHLGASAPVEVYRLMQFCIRDILEEQYGSEQTDKIFFESGLLAGKHFYENVMKPQLDDTGDFNQFSRILQMSLQNLNIGILRFEETSLENGSFVLTVAEDLDCSGLPETGEEICTYDEGFIKGIIDNFTGSAFAVKEIDCWCTGDRTCRFTAKLISEGSESK